MSKYEVVKKIMDSKKIDEYSKVDTIEIYLKGWYEEQEIAWIWEED